MTQSKTARVKPDLWEPLSKTLRRDKTLSSNQKILYTYMLDRYMFFHSLGNEFFETLDTLAEETGMTKNTVLAALNKLIEIDYIKKLKKHKAGNTYNNSYVVKDVYGLHS